MQGDDVFTVLPGTLDLADLTARLAGTDSAAIMKVGRNLPKIRQALADAGKLEGAIYVERGTMDNAIVQALEDRDDAAAPYFSQVLVPGWKARP